MGRDWHRRATAPGATSGFRTTPLPIDLGERRRGHGQRLYHRLVEHTDRKRATQQHQAGDYGKRRGAQRFAAPAGRIMENWTWGHIESIGVAGRELYATDIRLRPYQGSELDNG